MDSGSGGGDDEGTRGTETGGEEEGRKEGRKEEDRVVVVAVVVIIAAVEQGGKEKSFSKGGRKIDTSLIISLSSIYPIHANLNDVIIIIHCMYVGQEACGVQDEGE